MGERGVKPKGKVKIKWSADFAYAIGLLATDGCIYGGRHINLTSKDEEQIRNFMKALKIECSIGKKANGSVEEKKYFIVQFGDILFCRFLESIGITPAKSKTLGEIEIPEKYFFDFLRGEFDGDGYFHSYWDPRWKSSFMFYTAFTSASKKHIYWLKGQLNKELNVKGHVTFGGEKSQCYQLKYAKKEGLEILKKMFYSKDIICLSRKRLKIDKALDIVGEKL